MEKWRSMCYTCNTCHTTEEIAMLAVRLPEKLEHKLGDLAEQTGRTKSFYVRKAVEGFLEDYEDYLLALARLEKKNPRMSLAELEKKLGLED